jgi:hypothetical protein
MADLLQKLPRHPWLPFAVLLLLPFLSHAPESLLGLSTDPVWYYSWLTSGVHPGPWFGSRYLDPNIGFVSEALGTLAARDWVHGIIPWWNPYAGIGMPLAGTMQPGAFFLPFNLLLLLPNGMLWLMITMQIIAGLSTYALLRELGLTRLASLTGAILFELNGNIAWPGTAAYFCVPSFLPLLLWGIELARRPQSGPASRLVIALGIAYLILAGFPETSFICGLLALLWAALRCGSLIFALRVITGGGLGLLLASPLLIAFADLLQCSNAQLLHNFGAMSLPLQALGITFLPAITGGPGLNHGSRLLPVIWGNIGGYAGLLLPLLAIAGLASRTEIKLKLLLLAWILLAFARTFGLPPVVHLFQHIPFMADIEFYRYASATWELSLIILAAFALDAFLTHPPRWPLPFGATLLLLAICGFVARPGAPGWAWPAVPHPYIFLFWALSLACALAGLLLAGIFWLRLRGAPRRAALALLLVAEAALYFALPQFNAVKPGQLDTASLQFLRDNTGLSRTYALTALAPNYGSYFNIPSIDHNLIPVPRRWVRYIDNDLFTGLAPQYGDIVFWPSAANFGPASTKAALQNNLSAYLNLGVRYLLVPPGETLPAGTKVFSGTVMDIWELPNPAPYFQITQGGSCVISKPKRQSLTLDCTAPATLLRRELSQPGWSASINGTQATVLGTAGIPQPVNIPLFQQLKIPAGHSEIKFNFTPPYTGYGWLAALFSLLVLTWQTLLLSRQRRPSPRLT